MQEGSSNISTMIDSGILRVTWCFVAWLEQGPSELRVPACGKPRLLDILSTLALTVHCDFINTQLNTHFGATSLVEVTDDPETQSQPTDGEIVVRQHVFREIAGCDNTNCDSRNNGFACFGRIAGNDKWTSC